MNVPDQPILDLQSTLVPALGFGTYELQGDTARQAVRTAMEAGYRHIDTARMYENENAVGRGIADSGLPRDQVFLTTKIWFDRLGRESVFRDVEQSLDALQTSYLDLVLVHWPNADISLDETLKALEVLKRDGLLRRIGVSNFTPAWLRRAQEVTRVFCNQVECHPLLRQERLHALACENDMLFTAYSPLGQGLIPDNAELREIGLKYGKSPAQVALRWLLSRENTAVIPRSSNPEHIRANADIFDFALSGEDRKAIAALPDGQRQINPEFAPAWGEE